MGVPDCGEVVGAIPFREQFDELEQLRPGACGDVELQRCDALFQLPPNVHGHHRAHAALFCTGWPRPRLRCTSSSEIAAGVMPEMGDACPGFWGRCWLSFCCTSRERPRTSA